MYGECKGFEDMSSTCMPLLEIQLHILKKAAGEDNLTILQQYIEAIKVCEP